MTDACPRLIEVALPIREISAESVADVAPRFASKPQMRVEEADVTAPEFVRFAGEGIDTVFSLNVFEHIEDDVRATENVWEILRPGGRFVLVVPAHRWLYGTIDRQIGHYRRYDKQGTAALFRHAGFEVEAQKYINALGAAGWFVSARLFRNETPPSGQLRLFNKMVPLLKAIERTFPVPFGISLLTVGQKPD